MNDTARVAIRFSSGIAASIGLRKSPNPFGFKGSGEIAIAAESLELRCGAQSRTVAMTSIQNVRWLGDLLLFDCDGQQIGVYTTSREQAAQIAELLPRGMSTVFAKRLSELDEFSQRLDQLSPATHVTTALVGLNLLVFALMLLAGAGLFDVNGNVHVAFGSNFGPLTIGGQWWRLLTSTFIHFGLLHVAFNMWALWSTGRVAERLYGSSHFVLLYLASGIFGSLASIVWNPQVNSAGASGAIFGIFGGILAFVTRPRMHVPLTVMTEQRNSTLFFAGYSLLYGVIQPGIDNAAHVGGLVSGYLLGLILTRPLDVATRRTMGPWRWLIAAAAALIIGVAAAARIR